MFDPFACAGSIKENLLSYITSSLPVGNHPSQAALGEAFYEEWSKGLFKGPFVEALPKYEVGLSVAAQSRSPIFALPAAQNFRVLLERAAALEWGDVERRYLRFLSPRDRVWSNYPHEKGAEQSETSAHRLWNQPLYWHQWEAFRKSAEGRLSIVVATATGSGKTECFLLPLLYILATEPPADRARPGVRAILLFPMNALVEDQMRRLRKLLFWVNLATSGSGQLGRAITFGRYTGDTPIDDTDQKRSKPPDGIPELGEKVTRKEMRKAPPDILVTNFSMLEYAMLRSEDQELFGNPHVFRMLVLDEVHTYSGTVGAEVSMLLRRLRAFLSERAGGLLKTPVFVGTSATVGSGDAAKEDMQKFAATLFGVPFAPDQIILGKTVSTDVSTERLPPSQLREIMTGLAGFSKQRRILTKLLAGSLDVDKEAGWESLIAEDLEELALLLDGCWEGVEADIRNFDLLSKDPETRCRQLLAEIARRSSAVKTLLDQVQKCKDACIDLGQLAVDFFQIKESDTDLRSDASSALSLLLTVVANATVGGRALLPLRFHHFIAEQKEGLLCISPTCPAASQSKTDGWWSRLFVQHTTNCPSCNSLVFPLVLCRRCGFVYMQAWRRRDGFCLPEPDELDAQVCRFLFRPLNKLTESAEEIEALNRAICVTCGHWFESSKTPTGQNAQELHRQQCTRPQIVEVFEWSNPQSNFKMLTCPMCDQHYYGEQEVVTEPAVSPYGAATIFLEELVAHTAPPERRAKLISFSDTRRQAAKLAAKLQRTNRDYVFRQLLYQLLATRSGQTRTVDLFNELYREVQHDERRRQLFIDDPKAIHDNRLLEEVLANLLFRETVNAYYTLDSLGLVRIDYSQQLLDLFGRTALTPFWKRYIPDEGKGSFLKLVLDWGFRFRYCVSSAVNAIPYHPPKLQEWKIYQKRVPGPKFGPNQQTEAAFFLGRADSRNPLFNFMLRLTERKRQRLETWLMDRSEFNSLLETVWRSLFSDQKLLTAGRTGLEATRELIATRATEPDYATLQLNLNGMIWRSADAEERVFRCDVCGRLSHYSLGAVCPMRWCRGSLVEVSQQDVDKQFSPTRHYRRLIRDRDLRPLRVEEHTAQIANQRRLEIERLFKGDDEESVDVISGSTTFELGIDLGTINSVFLANLPPRLSNYRQRAGRAGRREGMVPFVLSYVRQRPHDQYYWRDLKAFVSGPVPTPKFKLASEVVLRRHGFSIVLSLVLKEYARAGRPLGSQWGPGWKNVSQFLRDPQYRATVFKSANEPQGEIAKAVSAIYAGVDQAARSKLSPSSICSAFFKQIEDVNPLLISKGDEGCIKVLGDYGILPTYSFPIYVDELRLNEVLPGQSPRCDLEPTRDRRISLSEFYPGNTVTAGKTQIRSKGIWDGFKIEHFKRCSSCGEMTFGTAAPNVCARCTGPCIPMQAIIPWGGYYGSVVGEGTPPEVELEEATSGEVIFDPANLPRPTPRFEGRHLWVAIVDANIMGNARMRQFSPRPGSKYVLQLQRRTDVRDVGAPHSPVVCLALSDQKSGAESLPYYLMHEFPTDIMRLRIMPTPEGRTVLSSPGFAKKCADAGQNAKKLDWCSKCFWQTLAEALLIASSKWLDVDDTANAEIGVTFRKETEEPCLDARELILYDTAPGGAGYASEVAGHLREVFQIAARVLNECNCGDSCYRCLRSYRNQWIHSRLDRGLVAEGLQRFLKLNWM